MQPLEQTFLDLQAGGIGTDLLGGIDAAEVMQVGVRLRTFGRKLPKGRMVVAGGDTFEEAMGNALAKAKSGRWETLDWSARPWEVRTDDWSGGQFGI